MERPPWISKKWTAYVITLASLIAVVAIGAPGDVQQTVAIAVATALPILIGGQSWIDKTVREAQASKE